MSSTLVPQVNARPSRIGDEFRYDQTKPPAASGIHLKSAFEERQLDAFRIELRTADRQTELPKVRTGAHPGAAPSICSTWRTCA